MGVFTRGFKRNADGVFERPIDDPNAQPPVFTIATGINDSGVVSGYYSNYSVGNYPGFLRHNGVFTDYSVPSSKDTNILGLNNKGDIVGLFTDANGSWYGFATINGVVSIAQYPGGYPHSRMELLRMARS